jgi:hypothetical protein
VSAPRALQDSVRSASMSAVSGVSASDPEANDPHTPDTADTNPSWEPSPDDFVEMGACQVCRRRMMIAGPGQTTHPTCSEEGDQ